MLPVIAGNDEALDARRLEEMHFLDLRHEAPEQARAQRAEKVLIGQDDILAASLGEVAGALEKRFGRKLNVTVKEDPSLIGGIRVVVGDEVLDTSVKARLEQMKVALTA
jgi:F-type H+-transporting ATPase subunit delta